MRKKNKKEEKKEIKKKSLLLFMSLCIDCVVLLIWAGCPGILGLLHPSVDSGNISLNDHL